MDLKKVLNYFRFSKEQSAGVLSLFVVVVVLQLSNLYMDFSKIVVDSPENNLDVKSSYC
jgi:hypothetical protein